jgi:NAD(P)-dependent dehydrogenase (short-subunit alcohol dehydrogenase family)
MKDFRGKVAVVTGAASGIGRALAERFAAEGMKVVLADVEEAALNEVSKKIEATGAETIAVLTDVSIAKDVDNLAQKTIEAFGSVHIVCNNAGVFKGGLSWETPLEDYEWHLGANTWGLIHGIRSFMPILIKQDIEAVIVNTSSIAGITCSPYTAAYCLSKHAAVALSECLYHELALMGSKVKVTVLCPMAVVTNIDKSERNRPLRWEATSKESSDIVDLVQMGLTEQLSKGITPEAMAVKTLQAIRDERFYIFSDTDDSNIFWRNINTRLDDIREGRNPTFPLFS